MRLGAPLNGSFSDPDSWIAALQEQGYRAAFCPVDAAADPLTIRSFANAASKAGIIIAETGAWSNPLSRDESTRKAALEKCRAELALAEEIGARCCVNIAGSYSDLWDGPHPDNFTRAAFDQIVETIRAIVDAVKPARTFYTLETMPWMYPDSTENYLRLIKAVDRKQFAVHFDPVNLICSPQLFYRNGEIIREFIAALGPYIRSCHVKDIVLRNHLTVHLDEARPGLGKLDYKTFLCEIDRLDPEIPLMLEHLTVAEDYKLAARYIRSVAKEIGVQL